MSPWVRHPVPDGEESGTGCLTYVEFLEGDSPIFVERKLGQSPLFLAALDDRQLDRRLSDLVALQVPRWSTAACACRCRSAWAGRVCRRRRNRAAGSDNTLRIWAALDRRSAGRGRRRSGNCCSAVWKPRGHGLDGVVLHFRVEHHFLTGREFGLLEGRDRAEALHRGAEGHVVDHQRRRFAQPHHGLVQDLLGLGGPPRAVRSVVRIEPGGQAVELLGPVVLRGGARPGDGAAGPRRGGRPSGRASAGTLVGRPRRRSWPPLWSPPPTGESPPPGGPATRPASWRHTTPGPPGRSIRPAARTKMLCRGRLLTGGPPGPAGRHGADGESPSDRANRGPGDQSACGPGKPDRPRPAAGPAVRNCCKLGRRGQDHPGRRRWSAAAGDGPISATAAAPC